MSLFAARLVVALALFTGVQGESHTLKFINNCKSGTPTLLKDGHIIPLVNGEYTHDGEFAAAIAYLQRGDECGFNAERCTMLEMTLNNAFSSVDVSLIAPHAFNVPVRFSYYNGCDGEGKACTHANCGPQYAFYKEDDYGSQVQCTKPNVNLLTTFCPDGDVPTSSYSSYSHSRTLSSMAIPPTSTQSPSATSSGSTEPSTFVVTSSANASANTISPPVSSSTNSLPSSSVPRKTCQKGGARRKRADSFLQRDKRNPHRLLAVQHH